MKMPTLRTYCKVAGIGAVIIGACGYNFSYWFEKRLRATKIYKSALEIVRNHEKTVLHLGEPIKEGKITFSQELDDIRKFSVNLKGSNTKGTLNCEVLVAEPEKPTITKVEIKFADIPNKIFVIKETQ